MYKTEKQYYKKSFLAAAIMAVILFLPFVIVDGGYFVYYMDYNNQQIPFYQHCVEAVHSGAVRWDWQTDLGANFVGSYSYYTLGSVFFWFMAIFPASFARYLMAPLMCVKFGLFSLFAFIYIRRFSKTPQAALIGGLLYAFSSFNLYSVAFQFQDAMLWFPLMLVALEEAVLEKRKGVFALTVALGCLANYFFFFQEVVFIIIYFLCRTFADKEFRLSVGGFLCLAFESVAGVLIAGVLFIPSIYQVLDTPRVSQFISEWDFLFYKKDPQIYGLFLESIFFPGEIPLTSYMFKTSFNTWTNAAAYLPLFSIAGVITYIKGAKKGHWVRYLLPICLLMYFIPGLNAMFTMMNSILYARWLYMPLLICSMATVCALEHDEYDWDFGYKVCEYTVVIMSLLVTCVPFRQEFIEDGVDKSFLVPRFLTGRLGILTAQHLDLKVLINIGLALAFLIALRKVLDSRKKLDSAKFMKRVTAVSAVCCMMLGYYYIGQGRAKGMAVGEYNKNISKNFEIDDDEFYRMETVTPLFNVNMIWGENTFESFHSVLPRSIIEMQALIGIRPNTSEVVSSTVPSYFYAYKALVHSKYLEYKPEFTRSDYKEYLIEQGYYRPLGQQNENELFISDYALPMGFAYDEYFPIDDIPEGCRIDNLMVGAVLLTKEQAAAHSDILAECGMEYAEALIPESAEDDKRIFDIFVSDAGKRIAMGVADFKVSNEGFTAKCDYDSEKLVMFSVPYCDGWTASVNGKPVVIENVNGGFCAIRVPSGACDITFEYLAPGMTYGLISTAAGLAAYGLYILIIVLIGRKKVNPAEAADNIGGEAEENHTEADGSDSDNE